MSSEASTRSGRTGAPRLLAGGRGDAVDRLARLAAEALDAPYCEISLYTDRQFKVGIHGLTLEPGERERPLEHSFCSIPVLSGAPLAIEDARTDPRVRDRPALAGGLARGYLGVPVRVGREVVGALCVFGPEPRRWTEHEVELLSTLSESVATEFELSGAVAALVESSARLDLGFAAANIGSFDWNLETDELQWDTRLMALFGYTEETFRPHIESFDARVHPDDRDRVRAAIEEAVRSLGDYATEFRVVHPGGEVRWVAARGRVLAGADGAAQSMLGAAYDTTSVHTAATQVSRLLETMGSAFLRLDADWRMTYVNSHAERLLGRGRDELLGKVLWDEFAAAVGTAFEERYRHAVETGEPVAFEQYYQPLDIWFEVRAWPSDEGLSVFFHDVNARVQAERARARATERLRLLSEAGSRLSATLEVEEILEVLAGVFLPDHGTWLAIALRRDEAELMSDRQASAAGVDLRVAHAAARDPARTAALAGALVGAPVEMGRGLAWQHRAAESMRAVLEAAPGWDGAVDAPEVVALVSRGRTIGAAFIADLTEEPADRRLLGEVTGRAAVALDNATLYGAERRFGRALQELLLPTGLPPLPGIRAAARYLAGTAGRDVGGDFFIGHAYPDGRVLVAIGDVVGHGIEAAARMGQLRAVVAAYAFEDGRVEALLERVAARSLDLLDVEMATMLVATYDPSTRLLTHASAGHPPLLVAPPGEPPLFVGATPGPPLGFGGPGYASETTELAPGSTVVLYTDGLVENRGESIDAGLERLRAALAGLRAPPEAVCDHVLATLGRERGGRDDIALLVLRDGPD